jgi:hypothetical protein
MRTVLLINHSQRACGVQQFGKRVYRLIAESSYVNYIYVEMERPSEYHATISVIKPDVIVYNWHRGTMNWLTEDMVKQYKDIKHYFIFHEEYTREYYDKYLFFGDYDFSGGTKFGDRKVLLPRPLLTYVKDYPKNDVLTIGSFGFGFWQKGYHTLTKLINDNYDRTVLNFHMPYSYYGDGLHKQGHEVEAACRKENTNPGVKLNITHDFLTDSQVLSFLAGNDINVFLYGENGEGISSVVDYAMSVQRPIAISESRMFRHIASKDVIVSGNNIMEILKRGNKPLQKLRDKWSVENFRREFDALFIGDLPESMPTPHEKVLSADFSLNARVDLRGKGS